MLLIRQSLIYSFHSLLNYCLYAIFGEKASDVKDTSLRMPTGMSGTVIDVQVFTREGIQRDKRAQSIIDAELKRYRQDLSDQLRIFDADAFDRIERLIVLCRSAIAIATWSVVGSIKMVLPLLKKRSMQLVTKIFPIPS